MTETHPTTVLGGKTYLANDSGYIWQGKRRPNVEKKAKAARATGLATVIVPPMTRGGYYKIEVKTA